MVLAAACQKKTQTSRVRAGHRSILAAGAGLTSLAVPPEEMSRLSQPTTADPDTGRSQPRLRGRRRGRARRRLRYLRQLRDAGGFVFDLYRFGERRDELVRAKLDALIATDREIRALEAQLGVAGRAPELRVPGVGGTCPSCGTFHSSDARFCASCGADLNARPEPEPQSHNEPQPHGVPRPLADTEPQTGAKPLADAEPQTEALEAEAAPPTAATVYRTADAPAPPEPEGGVTIVRRPSELGLAAINAAAADGHGRPPPHDAPQPAAGGAGDRRRRGRRR